MKMERISPRQAVDRLRQSCPNAYLIAYQGEESVNPDCPGPDGRRLDRGPSKLEIVVSALAVNVVFWVVGWLLWRRLFG
jgi:hypothetical protein